MFRDPGAGALAPRQRGRGTCGLTAPGRANKKGAARPETLRIGGVSEKDHSRPMHSVPVPINVRCYSNSDMIVRRREVTLRAHEPTFSGPKRTVKRVTDRGAET
jgi:hypothetical protein